MAHRRTEHYIILYYIILYYIALNPFFLFTSYCNYCCIDKNIYGIMTYMMTYMTQFFLFEPTLIGI